MSMDYPQMESTGQRGGEENRAQTKSNMTCGEQAHEQTQELLSRVPLLGDSLCSSPANDKARMQMKEI